MEELGLLDVALPFLSEHLRAGNLPLEESATVRNLATLNLAIEGGFEPSRAFTLACLFTDLHLSVQNLPLEAARVDLLQELRARGFPRGDTERMRLLLSALSRLMNPTRRTRGMQRRPYFVEAKALHDLVASGYMAPAQEAPPRSRRRRRRSPRWRKRRDAINGQAPVAQPGAATADLGPTASDGLDLIADATHHGR